MQVLLQADAPKVAFPLLLEPASDPVLAAHALQALGERLRQSYDVAREPHPVRLAELIERLARHEQAKD